MAKDKKPKKARKGDEADAPKVKKAKVKKHDGDGGARAHPLEALSKLADHPLVSELLAAGALAAVAAIADAGAKNPTAVKSADNVKKAGKAAAAAIGARLLKELGSAKGAAKDVTEKK